MNEYSLWKFYMLMQQWIDSDFERSPFNFWTDDGLCLNLLNYTKDAPQGIYYELKQEMKESFYAAGLDGEHPFNPGKHMDYRNESDKGTMYENEARINWIRKHSNMG